MAAELACFDGTIRPAAETSIAVTDDGLIRGDGAFEVVRVYDGRPFALDAHLARLARSAANLRLDDEPDPDRLTAEAAELVEARGGASFDGCLRIVLTRGGRRLLLTEPVPPGPDRVRLGFVTYAPTRVLDGVKSLSYAANMLATRLAKERGFDEALLVTPHGRVLESTTASVFWADADGALWTPPLDEHILASITRDRLLRLVDAGERPLPVAELLEASEAFIASTTREVLPVAGVEDRELAAPGEQTRRAEAALRAHIEAELA